MKLRFKKTVMLAVTALLLVMAAAVCACAEDSGKWVGAWGTGITEVGVGGYEDIGVVLPGDVTCRSIVTPTVSGTRVRLRLSNVYGQTDLKINRMTIAKSVDGTQKIDTGTVSAVFFNGSRSISVPAGEEIYSDPVDYNITAMEPIAVSSFILDSNEFRTAGFSGGTSNVSLSGNSTTKATLDGFSIKLKYGLISVVPFLSSIDVYTTQPDAYSVVIIGDSTVANDFPYYLAKQIYDNGYSGIGVVGKGIIGNSLLSDGYGIGEKIYGDSLLKRLDVDALSQAGVKYVVVKIGCNDIIHPKSGDNAEKYGAMQPSVYEMMEGYTELANRCHEAGVKVVCIAIMQWKGYTRDFFGTGAKYTFSESDWVIAQRINAWMETAEVFDYYVNLNPYSQDPLDHEALSSDYTADGAHPNVTLQRLWAEKFPLSNIGVVVKPQSIALNDAVLELAVNKQSTLRATVSPSNAVDKSVTWSTSDAGIATVGPTGVVKGVSEGVAVITCTSNSGNARARCIVTVYTPVSGVSVSRSTLSMYEGQAYTLSATVSPSNAKNKSVVWSSSNTAIATVNAAGRVTARNAGTAVITCRTVDGSFEATSFVNVTEKIEVTKVILSNTSKTVIKGSDAQLTASVYPSNATVKTFTWSSADTSVATVSSTGVVTGIKGGSTTVTCRSRDNGIYATCRIVVRCYAEGVKLNRNTLVLYTGRQGTLTATVLPADATVKTVIWSSDNPKIASVSSAGVVTANRPGTAFITCETKDFGFKQICEVIVKDFVATTGVKLNVYAKNIYDNCSYILMPTIYPANASNKNVKWTSSNPAVATVSSDGVVTGRSVGICIITCTTVNGGKTYNCKIRVLEYPAKGITLNRTGATLNPGGRTTLVATVIPAKATNKSVTWKTSNSKVATVSSAGVVIARGPGGCTITATTVSGGYAASCKIAVKAVAVTGVALNIVSQELGIGGTVQLKAVVSPSNATNKSVRWQSSNKAVASVSSTGLVTGLKAGSTLIVCSTVDGGKAAACLVTVKAVGIIAVKLNKTYINPAVGKTVQLTAQVLPENASSRVTWKSSDPTVAKVSSNGLVTALKKGSAEITALASDGLTRGKCKVIVS